MLKTKAGDIIGTPGPRFLRIGAVIEKTGMNQRPLYDLMAKGLFPKSIPLGPRMRAWLEEEVTAWQEARIAEREAAS